MSEDANPPVADAPGPPPEATLRRICAELIALRERTDRQHRLFEQSLSQTRAELQSQFDRFAADSQQAYQRLREEFAGEKRFSLSVLNALVDLTIDIQKVASPDAPEAVGVAARRAEAVLVQFGVHRYDAVVGSEYQPALHERIGGQRVDGMRPSLVAQQVEPGYASPQPDFVLRRAKVMISE